MYVQAAAKSSPAKRTARVHVQERNADKASSDSEQSTASLDDQHLGNFVDTFPLQTG